MIKFDYEKRLKAVKEVIEKGLSHRAAAEMINATATDVQNWLRLYREHGKKGLQIKGGWYDKNFKINVIEYMNKHHISMREVSVKFGIPDPIAVRRWRRIYYEKGPEALEDSRGKNKMINEVKPDKPNKSKKTIKLTKTDKKVEKNLITENKRLKMENAYLKKLHALVQERIQRENGKK
jgi:transposase